MRPYVSYFRGGWSKDGDFGLADKRAYRQALKAEAQAMVEEGLVWGSACCNACHGLPPDLFDLIAEDRWLRRIEVRREGGRVILCSPEQSLP